MEYINSLPIWHLTWLALTLVVGLTFSLRNYLIGFISLLQGSRANQNELGKIIDWVWLTSVLVLVALYLK